MMKRMMTIVLALVLMVSGAQAQSIFKTTTFTVNFGKIVGVEPVDTKTNTFTDQTTEVYENVTDDMFNYFGEKLGEMNYFVINGEERADGLYFEVGKDNVVSMTILYNQKTGKMDVSYANASGAAQAGSTPKPRELPSVFADCQQIEYGETVKISGYGRLTINKLVRGQKTDLLYSDIFIGTKKYTTSIEVNTYLAGHFENTGTQAMKWNQVVSCTLYYITDENTYTYKDWLVAPLQSNGIYIGSKNRSSGVNFDIDNSWPFGDYYNQPKVSSLDAGDFAAAFSKVPEVVQKSTDGMLAVVIQCNGEKFVIVDRWE